ncbi:predicted protein [Lichtheimia corymbifera JMRC:FSU:9682]|uniref:TFIIS central domain-containing protein n=1 Tax=Lichtheimia corymbifera JMRC:FSU:9682 TaxID=1263082 RepID=A0A068S436_9FUNG|nr:predicted protein [Lichtheimia corymbifera JMRC:FSU:9682]
MGLSRGRNPNGLNDHLGCSYVCNSLQNPSTIWSETVVATLNEKVKSSNEQTTAFCLLDYLKQHLLFYPRYHSRRLDPPFLSSSMETRRKSQDLLHKALSSGQDNGGQEDLTDLAKTIEEAIYEQQDCQVDSAYKETIRSHILNLKDSRNPLKDQLLSGQVDPVEFAAMTASEMATADRRRSNEELRRSSLQASMGYTADNRPKHRDLEGEES